eukprot:Pompholyxophrys_sp_v1_NODE_140_length_1581_cov_8.710509.p1 type:complete len:168 gc:universal NODE_140_length_1581_cov_8.710509:266-769(+)
MANNVLQTVFQKQATEEVKMHCVYTVVYLGYSQATAAQIYGKSEGAVSKWIKRFRETGAVQRRAVANNREYTREHRSHIIEFVQKNPLSFAHEIKCDFNSKFSCNISTSTVVRILHEEGFTHQVVERRAMEIRLSDVTRFTLEMNKISFLHINLFFLMKCRQTIDQC